MKYETIIFDFDGTLLYTIADLADAVNYALTKHGLAAHSYDAVQRMVGRGVRKLVELATPDGENNPLFEDIFADFLDYYGEHCMDKTGPYEGIPELLRELKARGVKMAIATNKYQDAAEDLRKRIFAESIDIIIGDHESRRTKPAPDSVYAALEALGASAETAVYVGDTEIDMETAKNSGLDCICVAWGYRSESELYKLGADTVIKKPAELLNFV